MSWSFKIARVAGIEVRLHVTFLVLLAWIGGAYYLQQGPAAAAEGLAFILALFGCVLLHEFGHAFAARAFGIHTPDITMLPIGGLARLDRMPDKPWQEFIVALAGPAVNVVIAAVLIGVLGQTVALGHITSLDDSRVSFLAKLATTNVALVLFNMVPAFPMDGGRVLRSLLAMKLDYARATHIAARIGQGLAVLFGLGGLLAGNPIWVFIALFVFLGASQEATLAQMKDLSTALRVADAMVTRMVTLGRHATLDEAVEALLRTAQHEFPVVDESGRILGVLTRDAMIGALKKSGPAAPVIDHMHRNLPQVDEHAPFEEAFRMMNTCGCPAVPVVNRAGQFVGLITPENIGELMMVQSLRRPAAVRWRTGTAGP